MSYVELQNVDNALESFLKDKIAIPQTARSRASQSQLYLRNVLKNKANYDEKFPEVLSRNDEDFLGGSFARHTKISPLDDIDIFFPLDGGGLIYVQNGIRLPYVIARDSMSSRLLYDCWKTGECVDSTKLLFGLSNALNETYPNSQVSLDGQCVNLQTTIAATSESDGIGFDVVPCVRLDPEDLSESFYLVPDGHSGWMRSNPRKDTALCVELNDFHNNLYRKAVRLVKYWNKTQIRDAFKSYYIELALSLKFSELKRGNNKFWSILGAFAFAMKTVSEAYSKGALTPLVKDAPLVVAPFLNDNQKAIMERDTNSAQTAFTEAYDYGRIDAAKQILDSIFYKEFLG